MSDLDLLARLVGESSPGPWETERRDGNAMDAEHIVVLKRDSRGFWEKSSRWLNEADAEAIAALRNAADWLITRARRAEELEAHLRSCGECLDCFIETQPHPSIARAALKEETL